MADVQCPPSLLDSQCFPIPVVPSGSFAPATYSQVQSGRKPTTSAAATRKPPPSTWMPACHPRVDAVASEVHNYFLNHWDFPTEKAKKTFLRAGFSRVTCLYFPLARDDRIHFACRLLTVLFLIDDVLEGMSFAEGEVYNARLIPISRGDVLPDSKSPTIAVVTAKATFRNNSGRICDIRFVGQHARSRQRSGRCRSGANLLIHARSDRSKSDVYHRHRQLPRV